MSDLDRLAERLGIEPFYHDIWGNRRETSDATKRALSAAMGYPAGTGEELAASLHAVEDRTWRRMLPPVLVIDEGAPLNLALAVPAGLEDAELTWTLTEEGGLAHRASLRVGNLPLAEQRVLDGVAYERRTVSTRLPPTLPLGYHRLSVVIRPQGVGGTLEGGTVLIVAPQRCLTVEDVVPGGRTWGIGLQLYALKSGDDWGIGDFDDLGRFAETAAGLGAGLVGLNPLHALFPADPNHIGPYSPSSRTFLNSLYIDVERVPELAATPHAQALIASEEFRQRLAAARAMELVDYPAVSALKMPVLEALHATFRALGESDARREAFETFRREMGEPLRRHAVFEALHEHFYRRDPSQWMWRTWPPAFQHPDSPEVQAFAAEQAERVDFFEYLQWEADRQLGTAAERGRRAGLPIGFYRDLAVAAHPGGAAAWGESDILVQGANVGAPPDQFNMKGQNWGLAPLSPVGLRESAYGSFIAMLRANMRHAGALRIDHVMALQHLFWIPADGSDGAYVEYPFEDLLRIIALESRRNGCIVIGEDLGTVPEGFRPALERAGILSYRVLYFERSADGGFKAPDEYPAGAMVTVTTHDLATFKGFWTNRDLDWRAKLDLYPDEAARNKDVWDRGVDRWWMLQALEREGLRPASYPNNEGSQPFSRELMEAVHRYLSRSPGRIAMVQIEDALGEVEQPNLPGTVDQHPNWRRRLGMPVEAMAGDEGLRRLAEAVRSERS
ncbi:4-alpha-glucanotransferase [Azospirillum baldaniorum]|uniref:4-alpha-glucanotransferase n=1 Tax=Azospirillum baldaniorum TaxID=1064539 RepID=A0A9P1JRK2_9PROT|nr:4-alpha-glucanotransferase [Azospirillum baldaniorum]AWJ89596.1 4-alpha-glucanotransferase [Azospirillum baldaniorum]TWA76685.1 4-alpha-glucanotransferase [Azospirillum brasilense]CCC98382.1 4-alpha-glucanotransferase (malQ-like) [Azospirillum baldaniorum]